MTRNLPSPLQTYDTLLTKYLLIPASPTDYTHVIHHQERRFPLLAAKESYVATKNQVLITGTHSLPYDVPPQPASNCLSHHIYLLITNFNNIFPPILPQRILKDSIQSNLAESYENLYPHIHIPFKE